MKLDNLSLRDFRNYSKKDFTFESNIVVICGKNGHGKTNILEAIVLLSNGKSWREKSGEDLIHDGEASALIEATLEDHTKIESVIQPRVRSFARNDKKISRKFLLGTMPSLIFAPEHMHLFYAGRRDRVTFFDQFFCQLDTRYYQYLSDVKKILQHKNALFKAIARQESPATEDQKIQINNWNSLLIEKIPVINNFRENFLSRLRPFLMQYWEKFSQKKERIDLQLVFTEKYNSNPDGVTEFFHENFETEIQAKKSLLSPFRDDFSFIVNNTLAVQNASRGEMRSILMSCVAAQRDLFFQVSGKYPLLLLDDIFSELDPHHQKQVQNLCQKGQSFITTTHHEHFEDFIDEVQVIEVG